MKSEHHRKFRITFLSICAVILGSTMIISAAVKPALMSKATNGNAGNELSLTGSVSADGRYVVFESGATNLVKGLSDTNDATDIFLRDTQTNTTRCITLAGPTTTGNGPSAIPMISANGRYVIFNSNATNLVAIPDSNNNRDVFRYDIQTGQIELVSVTAAGSSAGNARSGVSALGGTRAYDLSDDGRYVAFMSSASDLTFVSDTNAATDIFIRDMQGGFNRLATINKDGTGAGDTASADPSISANGRRVAFTSGAGNLIPVDFNLTDDIFIYDMQTQVTKCASLAVSGGNGTGSSGSADPVISKDGSRVAYYSAARDLTNIAIPADDARINAYVYDLGLRSTSLVSINVAGNASGNGDSGFPVAAHQRNLSISSDGRYVLFESRSSNLVGTTPLAGTYNVFRRDLALGRTDLVSINAAGTSGGSQNSFAGLRGAGMSPDGRLVTFFSIALDLTTDFPVTPVGHVYVRDMASGFTTALTLNHLSAALGNNQSISPAISANGKAVVFSSLATDLTPTNSGGMSNIFKAFVPTPQRTVSDFDGDGRTDFAVFRPAQGAWYVLNSDATFASVRLYGTATDNIVPADYTGDGRTDYAVFRPSNGTWYISDSLSFVETVIQFGQSGDKAVPQDYDGDGKTDVAIYRGGTWWWRNSKTGEANAFQFGLPSDIPVPGDFDSDGKADYAVFRPSEGNWYILNSSNGSFQGFHFGQNGDKPVPADYDGDGKTDAAIFRSGSWWILNSRDGVATNTQWGLATDIPVAGGYDGDGKADIAVFRPSDGNWYVLTSSTGSFSAVHFGQNGDAPTPASFIP